MFLILVATLISLANGVYSAGLAPNTVVLDGLKLVQAKTQLQMRIASPSLRTSYSSLVQQADAWLDQGPWSVINKTQANVAPNGTIHDYTSQAPYYWPSNGTADGCPYVLKDGIRNPESLKYTDHDERQAMFTATYLLSLAWWYTGEAKYGQKAGDVLRTWFLDKDTAMNPNLNHAQLIPCANSGRALGIIDFSQEYTSVVDAALILATGAPGWTQDDMNGFKSWNSQFLNWLETSDFGKQETAANNNHGTFALMQSAALALYTGDEGLAASKVKAVEPRIDQFITANGSQPLELARTRSFHYSNFDLVAYTRLAAIGQKVGVDLWGYAGPQGQSINQAVDFIIPAATGAAKWAYPELDFNASIASDIIHAAAEAGNAKAAAAVPLVPTPAGGDLWFVRPAVEQLDPSTDGSS